MNKINLIEIIASAVIGLILMEITSNPAIACNRTAGCTMDVLQENYDMMHSDKMSEAMRAAQDNMNAFRRLQEAQRAAAQGSNSVGR